VDCGRTGRGVVVVKFPCRSLESPFGTMFGGTCDCDCDGGGGGGGVGSGGGLGVGSGGGDSYEYYEY